MKRLLKFLAKESRIHVGREVIPPVVVQPSKQFIEAVNEGVATIELYDADLAYRISREDYSYAVKIGDHDHVKLVQTRVFHAVEKECQHLAAFIEEIK